jgi:hypothetical protein
VPNVRPSDEDDWDFSRFSPSSLDVGRPQGVAVPRRPDAWPHEEHSVDDPGDAGLAGAAGTVAGPSTPPTHWLAAAATAVLLALAVAAFGADRPQGAVLGWLLAGPVCIGLVTIFTVVDAKRRADPWYVRRPAVDRLRVLVLAAALLAVSLNAWFFADWASRR